MLGSLGLLVAPDTTSSTALSLCVVTRGHVALCGTHSLQLTQLTSCPVLCPPAEHCNAGDLAQMIKRQANKLLPESSVMFMFVQV